LATATQSLPTEACSAKSIAQKKLREIIAKELKVEIESAGNPKRFDDRNGLNAPGLAGTLVEFEANEKPRRLLPVADSGYRIV
jgi:hypothetical protein